MQKCKKCGASWNVNYNVEMCPFCGSDLKEKIKTYSVEDAFKIILEKHGQSVFQSETLLGLLGDYAPTLIREKKLVKVAMEAGAYKALCDADIKERKQVLNKYVSILSDSFFIDKLWAREALLWCFNALSKNTESSALDSDNKTFFENIYTVKKAQISDGFSISDIYQINEQMDPDLIIEDKVLKKYNGNKSMLILPSTIYKIAQDAFFANESLIQLIIPDSVRVIEKTAFAYCTNLERITFSNELKEVGEWAFLNCKKLKNCIIPDSVSRVGRFAFQGCTELAKVQISESITEIEEGTFWGCKSLVSVTFPKQLSTIKKMAFKNCSLIESIVLPEFLETIEPEAFACCWNLKKVTVTSAIEISSEMIEKIFQSNTQEITYLKKSSVLEKEHINNDILVVSSMTSVPEVCNRYVEWQNATILKIEEGVEEVTMEAFAEMQNLRRVEFPPSLKKIGFGAFRHCTLLNNVVIPSSVTIISAHAFEKCYSLTNITIPDSVKYVGDDAFRDTLVETTYVHKDCVICNGNYAIRNRYVM